MSLIPSSNVPTTSTSDFGKWFAEGLAHSNALRHAAALTPSHTLAVNIASRSTALRTLLAHNDTAFNTCTSPLLRLPREIQGLIFTYAAANQHVKKWIKLGQICSVLRAVLLELHCLWGDAIDSYPEGRHRNKLLERAGPTAPLWLSVYEEQGAQDAVQFAKDHLYRARIIDASQGSFVQWFIQNEDCPLLPHLEEVSLSGWSPDTSVDLEQPPRNTPQLTSVELYDIPWNFRSSTLTSLTIEFHRMTRLYSPSEFLDLLRQSKSLHDLRLVGCVPYLSDDLASAGTVSLPFLCELHVQDVREYALQLWRLLSVTPDARIGFVFICDAAHIPPSPREYTGPPCFQDSALFKHHLRGRQPSALEMEFRNNDLHCYILATSEFDDASTVALSGQVEPQATLKLEYVGALQSSAEFNNADLASLHQVCKELELFNITHLVINDDFSEGGVLYCINTLKNFQNLQYLKVQGFDRCLCTALGSSSLQQSFALNNNLISPMHFILPKLRELSLVRFATHTYIHQWPESASIADFVDMMASRSFQGCPLTAIKFQTLDVDPPSSHTNNNQVAFLDELRSQFPECRVELL